MKNTAPEQGSPITEKATNTITAVGHRMNVLAGMIRPQTPADERMGSAASTVANEAEAAGFSPQGSSFEHVAHDLTGEMRRDLLLSLLIGCRMGDW